MKEKLRQYVEILFAAAPRTPKAEEMKEELLANLQDKYEDLIKSGYDSMGAFHIALSGIGDPEELFTECRDAEKNQATEPVSEFFRNPQNPPRKSFAPHLAALVVLLLLFGPVLLMLLGGIEVGPDRVIVGGIRVGPDRVAIDTLPTFGVTTLCWLAAVGLIIYLIVRSVSGGKPEERFTPSGKAAVAPFVPPVVSKSEVTFKRITAGILAILLGSLGVHKFYLGFVGSGMILLLLSVFSLGILFPLTGAVGLIEGILYLVKTDRDFYDDYIVNRRSWF